MVGLAIIGAGTLGGELAHVLARRDVAATIRLIDDNDHVAAGKSLDIMQSAPIEGFTTRVSGSGDIATAAGADVILVADRFGVADWQGEEGLQLLGRLAQLGEGPVIVWAGAGARELVERGVREVKCRRERLLGSAPEALASSVRAIVSTETRGSARDVSLTVLGVPPSQIVVPWEDATIAGFAATSVLDEPARRRLAAKVAALWPPGPYALAWAAATAVEAILGKTRRTLAIFAAPDDSGGRRARAAALPVRLGPKGVVSVELPRLSARDQTALDNAMLL
jgi:malate dehydrogenase